MLAKQGFTKCGDPIDSSDACAEVARLVQSRLKIAVNEQQRVVGQVHYNIRGPASLWPRYLLADNNCQI